MFDFLYGKKPNDIPPSHCTLRTSICESKVEEKDEEVEVEAQKNILILYIYIIYVYTLICTWIEKEVDRYERVENEK